MFLKKCVLILFCILYLLLFCRVRDVFEREVGLNEYVVNVYVFGIVNKYLLLVVKFLF